MGERERGPEAEEAEGLGHFFWLWVYVCVCVWYGRLGLIEFGGVEDVLWRRDELSGVVE